MLQLILKKVAELLTVLLFVSLIVFFTFRLLPGDPAQMRLGLNPTPEALAALKAEMGLDKPLVVQYVDWIGHVLTGNLGKSALDDKSVVSLLAAKIPNTFELAIFGTAVALLLAVPAGVLASVYKHSWTDRLLRTVSLFGFSIPAYWLAVLLMLLLAYKFQLLPAGGFVPWSEDPWLHVKSLALPVVTVGIVNAAQVFRFLRAGMLEVIGQDYIRTARAKGISEFYVIFKHVARNALPGLITVIALNFSLLLSGMVVTEQIFAWPGLGWLMIQSILARDYDVVQGAVLVSALIIVIINLLGDLLNAALDPRIKYNG
ncbi:ABC transporter permease [Paenibacillus thalictri]|uniref:ABC transporter permease n=1 Tax=Paenibacillus thalictri TaxID=2527873 RepID=A0A4Q9DHR5_9BACL|nr:ABC transporter permease [Paenibacillus thalictri]TBL71063.1 ABC transporter permease [Paenibacillus thalictri]